jgi:hypothetical protein
MPLSPADESEYQSERALLIASLGTSYPSLVARGRNLRVEEAIRLMASREQLT